MVMASGRSGLARPLIASLKLQAAGNPLKKARICIHRSDEELVQEMIIVHTRNTYVRPHKHANKQESICILEGKADLLFFNDKGSVVNVIKMGSYASGGIFFYKIENLQYHMLVVKSKFVVFHEVTRGPFDRTDRVFASWAPGEKDGKAIKEFIKRM